MSAFNFPYIDVIYVLAILFSVFNSFRFVLRISRVGSYVGVIVELSLVMYVFAFFLQQFYRFCFGRVGGYRLYEYSNVQNGICLVISNIQKCMLAGVLGLLCQLFNSGYILMLS